MVWKLDGDLGAFAAASQAHCFCTGQNPSALAGVAANGAGYATATGAGAIPQAITPVFVLGAAMAALAFLAAWRTAGVVRPQDTSSRSLWADLRAVA